DAKILIVDDSKGGRGLYTYTLDQLGYTHLVDVESGEDAIDMLGAGYLPKLILIDTEMGDGIRGPVACKRIRNAEYGSQIGIIGMSVNPNYQQQWMDAGADDFFDKRIFSESEEVDRRIQAVLAKYQTD
ncbi:MAG: response regulator, partial [Candidatus Aenigmatarchaeota archaeon]